MSKSNSEYSKKNEVPRPKAMVLKAAAFVLIAVFGGLLAGDSLAIYFAVGLISRAALVLGGLWFACSLIRSAACHKASSTLRKPLTAWVSLAVCFVIFSVIANWKSQQQVERAKSFVADAVLQLEIARLRTGIYPKKLPTNLQRRKPPILDYFCGGKNYMFSYTEPLSLDETYHFDSDIPIWLKWSD